MEDQKGQPITLAITNESRDQKLRSTLQPHSVVVITNHRPRSQSYTHQNKVIVSQIPIPEVDEDETSVKDENRSRNTSFIKNPASRTNSVSSKRGKMIEANGGYENGAFMGKQTVQTFNRGYIDSARSSMHDGLAVQREQYCCFSRWSPFERRLATSIGILAGVIVALLIAIGLLAKSEGKIPGSFLRP